MTTRFKDRHEGGQLLADLLAKYAGRKDVLVLAIPPGGVPVAAVIAQGLGCAMDVLTVRTLNAPQHHPWQLEIVMGAVAPGGVRVLDSEVVTYTKVQPRELGEIPFPDLRGRTVILASDAIVIGSAMEAAIKAVRAKGAALRRLRLFA